MSLDDQMIDCWNGVSPIFKNYSNSEQDLFKTIFEYGFRRGAYVVTNTELTDEINRGIDKLVKEGYLDDPTNN